MILTIIWIKTSRHYRKLVTGVNKKDLQSVLDKLLVQADQFDANLDKLTEKQIKAETQALGHLQKVGFVRFNPFTDTGGDQSFCWAVVDGQGNGIVISSLHSREQTRIYAKRIVAGKTDGVELSREEEEALKRAQQA